MIEIKMSLNNLQFKTPKPGDSHLVAISMKAGRRRPKMEKQTAPTNEIMGPKLGMAMASKTEKILRH